MKGKEEQRESHNKAQMAYFSARTKPTMVPEATPYVLRQVDELVEFAGIPPKAKVLEVGCGMGRYTFSLAERGFAVHGLDLTKFLLEKLEQYNDGHYDIPLYHADIIDHPRELTERFDAVLGFFVLHHLHDLDACFKAMADMTAPGGCVTFLEPNAFNPLYYLQVLASPGMTWQGDGGIVRMRKGLLFNAMRKAGLVDLQIVRFGFFPPFLANRAWGGKLESVFERMPLWRGMLPFQLCKGTKA